MSIQTNVLEYIKASGELIRDLQKESAEKTHAIKVAVAAKNTAEKEASDTTTEAFTTEKIASTVDSLVEASFLKANERDNATSRLTSEPETALKMLAKLASDEINSRVKRIGKSKRYDKVASKSSDKASDQAWDTLMYDLERSS